MEPSQDAIALPQPGNGVTGLHHSTQFTMLEASPVTGDQLCRQRRHNLFSPLEALQARRSIRAIQPLRQEAPGVPALPSIQSRSIASARDMVVSRARGAITAPMRSGQTPMTQPTTTLRPMSCRVIAERWSNARAAMGREVCRPPWGDRTACIRSVPVEAATRTASLRNGIDRPAPAATDGTSAEPLYRGHSLCERGDDTLPFPRDWRLAVTTVTTVQTAGIERYAPGAARRTVCRPHPLATTPTKPVRTGLCCQASASLILRGRENGLTCGLPE